jgi:O-antigen/teichoic acid export membrane protein
MQEYIFKIKRLLGSGTAKDTLILFGGNIGSAFWGFVFTIVVARGLSVSDFGIFSAALNLVVILASLSDIGISSGSVNFIAENLAKGDTKKANEYIKSSFIIRLGLVLAISFVVLLLAPLVSVHLLATNDAKVAIWSAVLPIFLFPDFFFQYILQAKREFLRSTIYDNAFYIARLVFALIYYLLGALTMSKAFLAFGAGFLVTVILTVAYIRTDFIFSKPKKEEYKKLLGFSGWIAVNRIISSVSGRLDITMLAALIGATATGLYSIPSRLASFIIVLSGSFSAVLATRLAAFGDREKERAYILKSTLALLPITFGIIIWIIFAKPFVLIFGSKYLESVPVFQALAAAQIPFLFTVPAVTAIIYALKKTIYIGTLSFVQIAVIFILNYYLIPKYGVYGPTITFGITNTLLAIYVWVIVIKYYWLSPRES